MECLAAQKDSMADLKMNFKSITKYDGITYHAHSQPNLFE